MTITWNSLAYVTNFDELNLMFALLRLTQTCLHKMDYYYASLRKDGWRARGACVQCEYFRVII